MLALLFFSADLDYSKLFICTSGATEGGPSCAGNWTPGISIWSHRGGHDREECDDDGISSTSDGQAWYVTFYMLAHWKLPQKTMITAFIVFPSGIYAGMFEIDGAANGMSFWICIEWSECIQNVDHLFLWVVSGWGRGWIYKFPSTLVGCRWRTVELHLRSKEALKTTAKTLLPISVRKDLHWMHNL